MRDERGKEARNGRGGGDRRGAGGGGPGGGSEPEAVRKRWGRRKGAGRGGGSNRGIIIALILIIIAFIAGVWIGKNGIPGLSSGGATVTSKAVVMQIEECAELTSAKMYYAAIVNFDEGDIPYITKKSFKMYYSAMIYAGVDLTDVTPEIDDEARTITVTIPEATVLSVDVDEDSIEYYDDKSGLFSINTHEADKQASIEAEDDAIEGAEEHGLLDEAEESAKSTIKGFLSPFTEEEYADKDGNCYEVIVLVEGEDADEAEGAEEDE